MEALLGLIPEWLQKWIQVYIAPNLHLEIRHLLGILGRGILDTILFLTLPITLSYSSQSVWQTRYTLTSEQQQQVQQWASVANLIAYTEDVPPVVPLVLWYKEGGLRAENPANCEGIMGLYTAVKTGQHPCFPPGQVMPQDVKYQLQLGTHVFKEYCPQISYTTTDPELLKRCYLYYNAGPRSRSNPSSSAYVMNGYDAAHQNMIHTDIEGRAYQLQVLGAWPVHLAIQAQLAHSDMLPAPRALLAPAMLLQEVLDRFWSYQETKHRDISPAPALDRCREPQANACFSTASSGGRIELRPSLSPLLQATIGGSLVCGLLPGVELLPAEPALVVAPIDGTLMRYTDQSGRLAVLIENEEWSVWLLGLRSYIAAPGAIEAGTPVGAVSGVDSDWAAVHYAVYDKRQAAFVDPVGFLPVGTCPLMQ